MGNTSQEKSDPLIEIQKQIEKIQKTAERTKRRLAKINKITDRLEEKVNKENLPS